MHTLWQDLKYSVRTLLRSPVFTVVAVTTLALGIGANTAIFSVVNGVVLKPLQYAEPSQLVFITSGFPSLGFDEFWMSVPEYRELQDWSESFDGIGAFNTGEASLNGTDSPMRVTAGYVTAEMFETLGVGAHAGRVFSRDEDIAGPATPVVLLSYDLWRNAFGGAGSALGRTIEVDGTPRTIIGVMPDKFDIDDSHADVWIPMELDPANPRPRSNHFLYAVGRLKPDVSIDQARAEIQILLSRWQEQATGHSPSADNHPIHLKSLQEEVVGDVRTALFVLLGAVGFVLLIACANVGNLLLARAEARQKEIAVRTALGAGRGRLVRQFVTESAVLSAAGAALGLVVASLGLRALLAVHPESLPRLNEIGVDTSVLLFTLGVTVVAAILFGLAPLMQIKVNALAETLREGGRSATAGGGRLLLRRALVAGELSLAVILVVGAGLMLRSFSALQQVDPGFNPASVLTFRLFLPPATYPSPTSQEQFLTSLQTRLEAIPGVTAVTGMSGLPPNRRINANDMEFEGFEVVPDGPPQNIDFWQFVMPGYFEALNIPIVEGRGFGLEDMESSVAVAIVNETTARTYWPGESALGRRLRPGGGNVPWLTVVGVAKDVKQAGLEEQTGTETYFYYPQTASLIGFAPRTMNIALRTVVPPASIASPVREAVWALDAALPLADLQPFERVMSEAVARPRFLTLVLLIFGGLALVLAAVGTYGVMSYTVAQRTQELGIRMALGAEANRVVGMVLGQGMKVAVLGLVIGVIAAYGLTRYMASLLFGVDATDIMTFVSVPLVLVLVAGLACFLPAYRATQVDPMSVLRVE